MRKIDKGQEPDSLSAFKRRHPLARYPDVSDAERQELRHTCADEQVYLCAYCCQRISGANEDTMNEHVEAQDGPLIARWISAIWSPAAPLPNSAMPPMAHSPCR